MTRPLLAIGLAALLLGAAAVDTAPGTISAAALAQQIEAGTAPLVLDVRTPAEFDAGHVPGAVNVPYDELATRLGELPADRATPIVVYCRTGRRALVAESILIEAGFSAVADLEGHWQRWPAAESAPDVKGP